MTTYYVRKTGSDAAAGTSAGAAWLTIGKALTTTTVAGDTVYVGAGVYREAVSMSRSGSAGNLISILGDVDGAQTGDAGEVVWSAYTTNDTTAASGSPCLELNGLGGILLQNLKLIGGRGGVGNGGSCIDTNGVGSANITLRDCTFIPGVTTDTNVSTIILWLPNTASSGIIVDRCTIVSVNYGLYCYVANAATVSFDTGLTITNSILLCSGNGYAVYLSPISAGTGAPGGGVIKNNTIWGGVYGIFTNGAWSTTIPTLVYNNYIWTQSGQDLHANTSGQITEDYNILNGSTARSNVTAGTHSKTGQSYAPLLGLQHERIVGQQPRPFFMPSASSPLLGVGAGGTALTVDHLNRPRPAGGAALANSVGAYERHDTAVKEITVVDAGTTSIKIVGPGDHDFIVPVDATSTTITIRNQYDTNHGTGTPPQLLLLANGEIGVVAQTITAPAATGAWATLSLSAFTPTTKGAVTIRLVSRPTAATGISYFDTLTVA